MLSQWGYSNTNEPGAVRARGLVALQSAEQQQASMSSNSKLTSTQFRRNKNSSGN